VSEALERNVEETQRLYGLVDRLSGDGLAHQLSDGWTVSAALAHLAFWDTFAKLQLDHWVAGESVRVEAPSWHDDALNDAMLLSWVSVDPVRAMGMACNAAGEIDALLAGLDASTLARLDDETADTAWLLHRHRHRREHLDEIEQAVLTRTT
jgi:hypothetical protein